MVSCAYCDLKKIPDAIIIEGKHCYAAPNPFPTITGEILIVPKNHYTIFEQIPAIELHEMGILSKYLGAALFEAFSCTGTNIMISNGTSSGQLVAHTAIRIIPRKDIGELDTGWEPVSISLEVLNKYATTIRGALESINSNILPEKNNETKTVAPNTKTIDTANEELNDNENSDDSSKPPENKKRQWEDADYMVRQLFRKP
ncbi:MAG: HIT family protein [Candidatus Woesearchaeota archaeon]